AAGAGARVHPDRARADGPARRLARAEPEAQAGRALSARLSRPAVSAPAVYVKPVTAVTGPRQSPADTCVSSVSVFVIGATAPRTVSFWIDPAQAGSSFSDRGARSARP